MLISGCLSTRIGQNSQNSICRSKCNRKWIGIEFWKIQPGNRSTPAHHTVCVCVYVCVCVCVCLCVCLCVCVCVCVRRCSRSLRSYGCHFDEISHNVKTKWDPFFSTLMNFSYFQCKFLELVCELEMPTRVHDCSRALQSLVELVRILLCIQFSEMYGVASISRIDKIVSLFCKRAL